MILGIDEVGRGPWAGPLVVGAVVLGKVTIEGLNDSKKLSAKRREVLAEEIYAKAAGWGLGWVSAEEIDNIGLSEALKVATIRAVEQITVPYHEIIIDGTINFLKETTKGRFVTTLAKADGLIPAVSAASIIAKVARDAYMAEQADRYPHYGFEKHVGYGTANHKKALLEHGVTPLHRRSFAPIAALAGAVEVKTPSRRTTKSVGTAAEQKAANYLTQQGHTVIERNWRTPRCEIDIVSEKGGELHFTEVKYRRAAHQGDGFDAITPAKLRQMRFAAQTYMTYTKRSEQARLAVVSIIGSQAPKYLEVE